MKRALISVSDKTGVVEFAKALTELGYEVVSTGGTSKALSEAGVPVIGISDVTGFPEILEGRVKTLHPAVHGGILAKGTDEHMAVLAEHEIKPIDLVVVNLYPFQATVAKPGVTLEDAIENIDIGGPTMVRSAAKNHDRVGIIVNPARYESVIAELKEAGVLSLNTKRLLALEAFQHTAQYDAAISHFLTDAFGAEALAGEIAFGGQKIQELRYGENPHQKAAFYRSGIPVSGTLANAKQLNGKELSYNNIVDVDAAWQLVNEFAQPATVIVKHTNPCGTAIADTLAEAYARAYAADSVSAFGGIVAVNYKVDKETALEMTKIFLEIVAAPDFDEEALEVLKKKKNLRVLKLNNLDAKEAKYDIKYLEGKVLVQQINSKMIDEMKVVTNSQPTQEQISDMEFGMKVVKYVKSNAICIVKNGVTLAIGGGQTSRVWALENAIHNNPDKDFKGSVLASDAFFPFNDCVQVAANAGVAAIIQPGGSIKDQDSIDLCNELNIPMVFSGYRHFRH